MRTGHKDPEPAKGSGSHTDGREKPVRSELVRGMKGVAATMMNRRRFLVTATTAFLTMASGCARVVNKVRSAAEEATAPAYVPIPAPAGAGGKADGPRPLRVAILSDVHLQPDDGAANNSKLVKAVADLRQLQPDLWITNGDIADHGAAAEHEAFKRIMKKAGKPEQLLMTTGNHEFYDMDTTDDVSVKRFTDAYGQPKPYSNRVVGDVHFVMIADEQWKTAPEHKDWCWITPAQLKWLDQVLTEHKEKFTIVFMHQPLNETVYGSNGANAFGGSNAAKELRALVSKHKQIKLWFSGHTHRPVQMDQQVMKQGQTTFLGLGSIAYLVQPKSGGGIGRDTDAAQTRYLEIFPDKVVVRACDHAARRWMDELDLTIPRA